MKRPLFLLLSLALLILAPLSVQAQSQGVGVGASLGVTNGSPRFDRNPVGFNLKAWTSDRQAFSGMTSFFISGTNTASPSYWILQGDYLFHNFNRVNVSEGFLALYIGAGGQLTIFEDTDNQFALRSPLGVTYLLGELPIDVFVEVAPTLRVTDPTALRFDGAIGFRYYFGSGSNSPGSGSGSSAN